MRKFSRNRRWIALSILAGAALLPRVTVAMAETAEPELLMRLPNGGFESVAGDGHQAMGWSAYGDAYLLDHDHTRSGTVSLKCENRLSNTTAGAFRSQSLNQKSPTPVVVSGWSRAEGVEGESNSDYAIYVDLTYIDGTELWAQTASFDTGTHDWQRRHLVIIPPKPIRTINVYAIFRNHAGKVWFDDFDAHEFLPSHAFDGQEITAPILPKGAGTGWFVRDVAAGSAAMPIARGQSAAGVKLVKTSSRSGTRIVEASLQNTTASAKCVTVYYVERCNPKPATWWNDVRESVAIRDAGEYGNLESSSTGANGHISLYPFGCVTSPAGGRALGVPPTQQPCVSRIVYNAQEGLLYIAFDIALTPKATPHDHAGIAVARYDVDPKWGFRDAAAKFYALFPEAYRRRAKQEGIWMPFTAPSLVKDVADFHIAYHEGDNSVDDDRKRGILSFRYVEPMSYWMPMAKEIPRTYDAAIAAVRKQAAGTVKDPTATDYQNDPVRQSQAVLYSGTQDAQGRFNVAFRDVPWCNGAVWVLNPNPALPLPEGKWTKALLNSLGKPVPGKTNEPDGEFLDSLEMWANTLDYSPDSLAHAGETPTYTPDTFQPVVPTWFSVYESTAFLSDDLHRHGKLLMANATPWGFTAFGPLLDVMGTETDMFTDGAWTPEPDARFNLRRTLCYYKPYLLLLNTDFSNPDSEKIELYFERCLFYGVFPSMYSANAASNPYWENPALYNRDRPLFKKYLPILSTLSSAGWEPVTLARTNDAKVWLERYGNKYLTVLNSGKTEKHVDIALDDWKSGSTREHRNLVVTDMLTGTPVATIRSSEARTVSVSMKPSEVRVLSLSAP